MTHEEPDPPWRADIQKLLDEHGPYAGAVIRLLLDYSSYKARSQAMWEQLNVLQAELEKSQRTVERLRADVEAL